MAVWLFYLQMTRHFFSSQNEQDTRNYGRLANVPILEPSNCQEVKDMVKYAF